MFIFQINVLEPDADKTISPLGFGLSPKSANAKCGLEFCFVHTKLRPQNGVHYFIMENMRAARVRAASQLACINVTFIMN